VSKYYLSTNALPLFEMQLLSQTHTDCDREMESHFVPKCAWADKTIKASVAAFALLYLLIYSITTRDIKDSFHLQIPCLSYRRPPLPTSCCHRYKKYKKLHHISHKLSKDYVHIRTPRGCGQIFLKCEVFVVPITLNQYLFEEYRNSVLGMREEGEDCIYCGGCMI